MLFNYTIGFIIPWIFGVWLFHKDKKIVLLILPFTGIVSHTINSFGFTFGFWTLKTSELYCFSAIPFDLGLFALSGCALIYTIKNIKIKPYLLIFIFTITITVLEYIGLTLGYIEYGNGWNIFYSYFSYLIPFNLVYWYYLSLKKLDIF